MDWIFYSIIFVASVWFMHLSSRWIIVNLMRLSKILKIREFIVGFCVMAVASSLPNLFLGITSAAEGVPELSLGDVFGNNFVAMTLAVAVAIFFAKKKEIETDGKTIQTTAIFTMGAAILPIILLFDGVLSRSDGIVLLIAFVGYLSWLIIKENRFTKVYNGSKYVLSPIERIRKGLKDIGWVTLGIIILVFASVGIVSSASFFALGLGVPIVVVGLLVTGLGNALPEIYFAIETAKHRETQLIIGNLMGSVIFPATFVLGVVALMSPIHIQNLQYAVSGRIFLLIASVLFLVFTRSKGKISQKEGYVLLALYVLFIVTIFMIRMPVFANML